MPVPPTLYPGHRNPSADIWREVWFVAGCVGLGIGLLIAWMARP